MSRKKNGPASNFPAIVYVAAGIAAIAGILFGFDTGIISGAILFIVNDFSLSSAQESLAVSMVLIGAVAGAASGGLLAQRLGRRRSIIAASLVFLVGTAIVVFSPELRMFLVGRLVIGAAIGIASFIGPMYISEVSPKRIRGGMVSLNQLMITVGILLSYVVSLFFAPSANWRAMFLVGMVPAAILLVGISIMPSSPRWLVFKGRTAEASQVIRRFLGPAVPDPEVETSVAEMESRIKAQRGTKLSELFSPQVKMATLIGVGLAILQQATGVNTVIYYAPTIFQFAGLSTAATAISASVIVGAINVVFTVVSIVLVDRLGRRPLLLVSLSGMIIALLGLGGAFMGSPQGGNLGTLAVILLMVYIASFAVGLGPIFWLLISEIYPLRVRGPAMSLATVANWTSNLIISITFLGLVDLLGKSGVFFLYAAIGIIAWSFVWRLVPETKNVSLEEIEKRIEAEREHRPKEGVKTRGGEY